MSYVKLSSKQKRKYRVRSKVSGTTECPRLSVFRSNRYLYAQIIDDTLGKTVASAHSLDEKSGSNKASGALVGKLVAEKALAKQIKRVVFDRGSNRYHGVIKEVAENARKAGLVF